MDAREKLVELIRNAHKKCKAKKTCHECEQYGNGSDCVYLLMADELITNGVTVQEWISVKDMLPEKDGQYLIFTTQYFTPDHIDEIDHKDGIEISGYCKRYGFLSKNGIHAKYWRDIPQSPKGE